MTPAVTGSPAGEVFTETPDAIYLALRGAYDASAAELVTHQLKLALSRARNRIVLVDLRRVTFLDSALTRIFAEAHRHAKFILFGANEPVRHSFTETGTHKLLFGISR